MESSLLYGLATLGAGLVALLIRYAFKSKCIEVQLCYGLVNIKRDIEGEVEAQEMEGDHTLQRQRSTSV